MLDGVFWICYRVAGGGTCFVFFFQAEDGIRDADVTGVQTCALPIFGGRADRRGQQGAVARELAAQQPRGGATAAGLEADHAVAAPVLTSTVLTSTVLTSTVLTRTVLGGRFLAGQREGDRHLGGRGERAGRVGQRLGGDEHGGGQFRAGRSPAQLANGEPVPGGGDQRENLA